MSKRIDDNAKANFQIMRCENTGTITTSAEVRNSLTITPRKSGTVFIFITGDMNPSGSAWMRIRLYDGDTELRHNIIQSNDNSSNHMFSSYYIVSGLPLGQTHTFTVAFIMGNGTATLREENVNQSPVFCLVEL